MDKPVPVSAGQLKKSAIQSEVEKNGPVVVEAMQELKTPTEKVEAPAAEELFGGRAV